MWPFRMRADPEPEKTETESNEDALLRASLSDDYMTRDQAMNVPAFASCVNLITETISTIPFKLYKLKNGKLEEIKDDPRVDLINNDTGDTLDGVQFKRAITKDYFLGKGGYAYINRMGNRIESLHYVKESEISFMYNPDPIFKDYNIMIQGKKYNPFEFLKILRNTEDGRSGKSIVDENSEVLSVAYYSLKYEKNLVKTGGNKKGFIKSPKKLAQAAIDALKKAWRNLYQNNTENVVVLNEGLEFQEASNTSVEMQLNENKKTNSDEICKLFNMPPAMINGNATEQDKTNFVQYCLNKVLKEIECALNRDLLLEKEKGSFYFAADTSELTKGDIEKRFRAYEIAGKNGFLQIDEIRLKENLPPLGLDFVRLGLQDVLYDPETKQFYTPNMNATGGLGQQAQSLTEGQQKAQEKKSEESGQKKRARQRRNLIVVGAPGSGKTTWVMKNMQKNDCMVDWDRIRSAISGDIHSERPELIPMLLDIREVILNQIESGNTEVKWYIVTTQSDRKKLDEMAGRLNADIKVMDTPLETTIAQINRDNTREDKAFHIELAREWYEKWKEGEKKNED